MAIRIDPKKPFMVKLDLTPYVVKNDDCYHCTKCGDVLVRIEPDGILGRELNQLDTTVILDHHLTRH